MKARTQRTHFMGFSNRNPSSNMRTTTADLFEKSFNKSKSQYYQTTQKIGGTTNINNKTINITKPVSNSLLNINTVYREAQKGHHHEFESKRLTKKQKDLSRFYQDHILLAPLPLNMNKRLNKQIEQIRSQFKDKQINLHKLNQLKHTFLRNNQNKRNLKQLFTKYSNQNNIIDKTGFKKLIKQYGYDINQHQINLVFKLNHIHDINHVKNNQITFNSRSNNHINGLDINNFVNLMTKQNVYFKTLKLYNKDQIPTTTSFRFNPPDFQVFRNKFAKLKQAFNIYKGQNIDSQKFQKVMKKLDINDLVIKSSKRSQIFNNFTDQKGNLNVQKLLGLIATQEYQRVKKSGNQLKVTNYDNFDQNIAANQQFVFEKIQNKDPLLNLLYPVNMKKTSFIDYERNLRSARQVCQRLKQIKQHSSRDVIAQLFSQKSSIKKQDLYKKVQKLLQSQGYNFNKNQYKSFLSYLDFDSTNHINNNKFQNIVFKEDQRQRVNRLDRRVRNDDLQDNQNQENYQFKLTDDKFVEKFRSKSSGNWTAVKKSVIRQENIPQFNVPTKFSAWPQRLYNAQFSLLQAKNTYGMGITQNKRFQKQQKHSFGQQDRLRKMKIYQNKVRKIAQWSQINQRRIQEKSNIQQHKQASRNYNLRLLKQQYEERCHQHSLVE